MRSRSRRHDERTDATGDRRRERGLSNEVEPVVLTRKLADAIDGINLAGRQVGDRLPLSRREAVMLIAEGWAQPTPAEQRRHMPGRRESDHTAA